MSLLVRCGGSDHVPSDDSDGDDTSLPRTEETLETLEDTSVAPHLPDAFADSISVTNAAHGQVYVDGRVAPPSITYLPGSNYFGADSFTVLSLGVEGLPTARHVVNVVVQPVDDLPVGLPIATVETLEDTPSVTFDVDGFDVDDTSWSIVVTQAPSHGSVNLVAELIGRQTVAYVPALDFFGTDNLTFVIRNAGGDSQAETITFDVAPVNDAPVIVGQAPVEVDEDASVLITASAEDVEDGTATVTIANAPSHGSIVDNGNGTWTYSPSGDFNGSDNLSVTAMDTNGAPSAARVIDIVVHPVNDGPSASAPQPLVTVEDTTSQTFTFSGSDIDGDELTVAITTAPAHGILSTPLSWTSPVSITYTPDADYNGPDAVGFTISDGVETTVEAALAITITAVNDAPTGAIGPALVVAYRGLVSAPFALTGSDVDSTPTFAVDTVPTKGTLTALTGSIGSDVRFQASSSVKGADSFDFVITDGELATAPVTVPIQIDWCGDGVINNDEICDGSAVRVGVTLPTGTICKGAPPATCIANDTCQLADCSPNYYASSGKDGAFVAPAGVSTLAPGTYHFTTITIPAGATVKTNGNGELDLRATGDVVIAGTLNVSGGDGQHGQATQPAPNSCGGSGGNTGEFDGQASGRDFNDRGGFGGVGGGGGGIGSDPAWTSAEAGQAANHENSSYARITDYGGGAGAIFYGGGGGGVAGGGGAGINGSSFGQSGGSGGGPGGGAGGLANQGGTPARGGSGGQASGGYAGVNGGNALNLSVGAAGGGGSIGASAAADLAITDATFYAGSSGGGGGNSGFGRSCGGGGGGGGGAVRVTSATQVTVSGAVRADGGKGGNSTGVGSGGGAGGGSGGLIYIQSPKLTVTGTVSAGGGSGGSGSSAGGAGGLGRVRLSVDLAQCTLAGSTFVPALLSGCGATSVAERPYIAAFPN